MAFNSLLRSIPLRDCYSKVSFLQTATTLISGGGIYGVNQYRFYRRNNYDGAFDVVQENNNNKYNNNNRFDRDNQRSNYRNDRGGERRNDNNRSNQPITFTKNRDNRDVKHNNYNNNNNNSNDNDHSYQRYYESNQEEYIEDGGRRDRRGSERNFHTLEGEGLYGVNPIDMALNHGNNRTFNKLYIFETLYEKVKNYKEPTETDGGHESFDRYNEKKDMDKIVKIVEKCRKEKIPIQPVNKQLLDTFSKFRLHQGLVMDCSPLTVTMIDKLLDINDRPDDSPMLVLALDELWDSQNIGAIVRSCYFFGITGVVITDKKNGEPLISPNASKASSGTIENFPIYKTVNMSGFLRVSRKNGWQVIGTTLEEGSTDLKDFVLNRPTILVIGNEGFGLNTKVRNQCDKTIKIMGDSTSNKAELDSLNVSVAAGVSIYTIMNSAKK